VDGLFGTEVPVQSREATQRDHDLRQALAKVLVKVSGYRDTPERPELAEALAEAPGYVQQFRYLVRDQSAGEPTEWLRVIFDGAAVTALLRERSLPVWSEVRPAVLLWLGLETPAGYRWYTPDTDPGGWDALQRAADERGLPLLLPLLDLEDQARLRPAELEGGYEPTIWSASQRYAPDAVLVGTLGDRGGAWRVSWTLLQDTAVNWQSPAGSLDEVLAAGVHRATDILAARYVPRGMSPEARFLELRVTGVVGLADFARVRGHLDALSVVEHSRLLAVEPGVARFQLRVAGGAAALERGMALGGLLEPDTQGHLDGAADDPGGQADRGVLSYRVRP
jgi:hypothetical protein